MKTVWIALLLSREGFFHHEMILLFLRIMAMRGWRKVPEKKFIPWSWWGDDQKVDLYYCVGPGP